ncbi:MAG: type II toxin-antitoxin system MqsA family antitoxin [Deltaproteobacteria bacterium]|jgi:YgiT-type zinc finger domain-containing protein|nr:type II toxin-antitoxin system MqsA family antitoxin [Deltaproteobacteria bacterium]MBW2165403.1 type II toxin-antitoxin system MqsA family antitoxin [Deltaproteobacteria bacterium]
MSSTKNICPLCGGLKKQGTTTFTVDMKDTLVVIRNVPATLCSLCGNEWLSDEVAANVESMVEEAKNIHRQVEVTQYRKVA